MLTRSARPKMARVACGRENSRRDISAAGLIFWYNTHAKAKRARPGSLRQTDFPRGRAVSMKPPPWTWDASQDIQRNFAGKTQKMAMKKRVYIVESHHHAIREWFIYRECEPHLLSFDYHTDFHEAFIRKAGSPMARHTYSRERHNLYLQKHIPCEDVDAAINDLENDEQIDFAIRSRIIKKAFVFSHNEYHSDGRVLTVPPIVMSEEQIRNVEFMNKFAPRFIDAANHSDVETKCALIGETLVEKGIVSYPEYRHPQLTAKDESEVAKLVATDTILDGVLVTFCKNGFNRPFCNSGQKVRC